MPPLMLDDARYLIPYSSVDLLSNRKSPVSLLGDESLQSQHLHQVNIMPDSHGDVEKDISKLSLCVCLQIDQAIILLL